MESIHSKSYPNFSKGGMRKSWTAFRAGFAVTLALYRRAYIKGHRDQKKGSTNGRMSSGYVCISPKTRVRVTNPAIPRETSQLTPKPMGLTLTVYSVALAPGRDPQTFPAL